VYRDAQGDDGGKDRDDPDGGDAGSPLGRKDRLWSKDSAAIMVSTTTAAKNSTPAPGSTDITGCSCTSATVKVSTNTSSIDQRPMNSTMRYSRVRSGLLAMEPRCTVIRR
jgi:hypothetical protein